MDNEDGLGVAVTNLMSRQMLLGPERVTAPVPVPKKNKLAVKTRLSRRIRGIDAEVLPRTFHHRYCSLPVYIWILAEGMYGNKSLACFKGHRLKSSDSSEKSDNRQVNVSTWNLIKTKATVLFLQYLHNSDLFAHCTNLNCVVFFSVCIVLLSLFPLETQQIYPCWINKANLTIPEPNLINKCALVVQIKITQLKLT